MLESTDRKNLKKFRKLKCVFVLSEYVINILLAMQDQAFLKNFSAMKNFYNWFIKKKI